MTSSPKRIDPESFKGKLYLLVVDKLVLGAIIAASFAVYDHWKTNESRRYSEEAQKATYVRELVPIVVTEGDVLLRAQMLAALIGKRAIDAPAAFALTERLLRSGLMYSERPCDEGGVCLGQHEEPFLTNALVPLVPQALPALLNQWMISSAPGSMPYERPSSEAEASRPSSRYRREAPLFWEQVLAQAINSHSDSELIVLNDDVFLGQYFGVLARAARSQTLQLTGRKLKALRIIYALDVLSRPTTDSGVDEESVTQLQADATAYLMSLANQPMSEDRENVISDVVRLLDELKTGTATETAGRIRSAMSNRRDTQMQFLWPNAPN